MGMYPGLKVTAKIKQEFVEELSNVLSSDADYVWKTVDLERFRFVEKYANLSRSNFIPFGAVCYMPSDWDNKNSFENGVWKFCCSLKNYDGEIEIFLKEVLVEICEWAKIERLYEEESVSALLEIEQGNLRVVRESVWEFDE